MPRLAKTRGIVIRHAARTETSRVVHWLTEDHGRITTLAKGAMRPRNHLLGQFDQMYTCELVFYTHDHDAVFITREITPLACRNNLRSDWRAAMAGLYLCDLASRVTPPHEPIPEMFALLEGALDNLDAQGWLPPLPLLFELRLLSALGLTPRLDHCAVCDRVFETGSSAVFDVRQGGMVCRHCPKSATGDAVGADTLAILRHWQASSGWNLARTARCTSQQLEAMGNLIGNFLGYHLDIAPMSRQTAMGLLYHNGPSGTPPTPPMERYPEGRSSS